MRTQKKKAPRKAQSKTYMYHTTGRKAEQMDYVSELLAMAEQSQMALINENASILEAYENGEIDDIENFDPYMSGDLEDADFVRDEF